MLARRIIAKHEWTKAVMQRIVMHYVRDGTLVPCLPMQLCLWMVGPPCGACTRSTWTEQAHTVLGPIGLLRTSLAQHRSCIKSDLTVEAKPGIALNLQYLPYQQFKPAVDVIAAECHTHTTASTGTAYRDLKSYDKVVHQTILAKLQPKQRALVCCSESHHDFCCQETPPFWRRRRTMPLLRC